MMDVGRESEVFGEDGSIISLLSILSSCLTELLLQLADLKLEIELFGLQSLEILIFKPNFPCNLLLFCFLRILIDINTFNGPRFQHTNNLPIIVLPKIMYKYSNNIFIQLDLADGLSFILPIF